MRQNNWNLHKKVICHGGDTKLFAFIILPHLQIIMSHECSTTAFGYFQKQFVCRLDFMIFDFLLYFMCLMRFLFRQ